MLGTAFWVITLASFVGSLVAFVLMERNRLTTNSISLRARFWEKYKAVYFDEKGRFARLCCVSFLVVAAVSIICFVIIAGAIST